MRLISRSMVLLKRETRIPAIHTQHLVRDRDILLSQGLYSDPINTGIFLVLAKKPQSEHLVLPLRSMQRMSVDGADSSACLTVTKVTCTDPSLGMPEHCGRSCTNEIM